ncbi:MAG: hypothetical protein ABW036_01580 [Flavitalea sp.]
MANLDKPPIWHIAEDEDLVRIISGEHNKKTYQTKKNEGATDTFDKNFKPAGAIAFFLLLCLLGAIIYFGIYLVMINRI